MKYTWIVCKVLSVLQNSNCIYYSKLVTCSTIKMDKC